MHEVGVVVSFNSDSDELARRMNVEAAKAVKYGGVPRTEAFKFVSLNPAKQLKVDEWVGSLEPGKDADFVIWSGDPLSSMSRCEATYIDGREYFSIEKDAELRAEAQSERQRLLQKIVAQGGSRGGSGGGPAGPGSGGRRFGRPGGGGAPPTMDALRAGGRGWGMVPVGGDETIEEAQERAAAMALEEHFLWMIRNGLDPLQNNAGDCGCALHNMFQVNW
jgi:hypothetical protein